MPEITVDVKAIRLSGLTTIDAKRGDRVIQSVIADSEVVDVNSLATWLLAQQGQLQVPDVDLQKRLTITSPCQAVFPDCAFMTIKLAHSFEVVEIPKTYDAGVISNYRPLFNR